MPREVWELLVALGAVAALLVCLALVTVWAFGMGG